MHAPFRGGIARRVFPVLALAAFGVACSDELPSTAPARMGAPRATPAMVPGGGNGCGRCVTGQIAFVSNRDGNLEIYVAADTANAAAVRLTNSAANELFPAWSPDYKKIAFTSYRDGNAEIYLMNGNGAGVLRLTNTAAVDAQPVYSPDGKKKPSHRIATAASRSTS